MTAGIDVALRVDGGRVVAVTVANRRPRAAAVFVGKPVEQALPLLPLLFSLCGTAQLLAGLAAVEAAAGIEPAPPQRSARRLLLAAETALEHGHGVLAGWSQLQGEAPDCAALKALRHHLTRLRQHLFPEGDQWRPGGGRLRPACGPLGDGLAATRATIGRAIFADDPQAILADAAALSRWAGAGTTAPARLIGRILDDGLAGFGASPTTPLPADAATGIVAALSRPGADAFAAQPSLGGGPCETGPWARRHGHPLVAALTSRHGNGLLARFAARLVDLMAALDDLEAAARGLDEQDPPAAVPLDGQGAGTIETARGLLVHRVELAAGTVRRYQMVAPTEWNFHPAGPLATGLVGQPADGGMIRRSRLLVAALDPCVDCTITQ